MWLWDQLRYNYLSVNESSPEALSQFGSVLDFSPFPGSVAAPCAIHKCTAVSHQDHEARSSQAKNLSSLRWMGTLAIWDISMCSFPFVLHIIQIWKCIAIISSLLVLNPGSHRQQWSSFTKISEAVQNSVQQFSSPPHFQRHFGMDNKSWPPKKIKRFSFGFRSMLELNNVVSAWMMIWMQQLPFCPALCFLWCG